MKIDGKELSRHILEDLKQRVGESAKNGVTPHLAIILVGDDPASIAYVHQKELRAKEIGVKTTILKMPSSTTQTKLSSTIEQFNKNNNIHGLIVQRPLPPHINIQAITQAVEPSKDIDGLRIDSPYQMPLAVAVLKILEHIFIRLHLVQGVTFEQWLRSENIVVLGKGLTAGGPVITLLKQKKVTLQVIDSKTENKDQLIKQADIVISAIGKPGIITSKNIKKGVILISIGLKREESGKLHGDYEEEDICDIASFYTPTPGGVGPVNVAMLLNNLVQAAIFPHLDKK